MTAAGKNQMKNLLLGSLRELQKIPAKIQGFFRSPETIYAISQEVHLLQEQLVT
jgi:hypothetical protein